MKTLKFFIYSRKSVYTGKGESIENQIEMCRQYIHAKFSDVSPDDITVYEDEGFSAKNTDRPQFRHMLRDIRQNRPDFVICYRLDRISRSVSDFSALIEELNELGISFVCIKEEFDTSKPMGKAMMYIASVFAQLERETIAERVRDNMLLLARTGRWLGGTTPTGFTSEKLREIVIDGKIKTSCRLKDKPSELSAVVTMFDKFLELQSISGVSRYLSEQNIRSRSGSLYSLPGIKQILQNPVYCTADEAAYSFFTAQNSDICFEEKDCTDKYGLLSYNKRDYKKKNAPRQTMDKWIIAIGKHKGVIPGNKWVAVQNLMGLEKSGKAVKTHNDYSLLSGLIVCGKCGSRMLSKRRFGRDGSPYDYVCSAKLHGGTKVCSCQNIGGAQTDGAVCRALLECAGESADILKLLEKLKKDLQGRPQSELRRVDAQIQKCRSEISDLLRVLTRKDLHDTVISHVNTQIAELENNLAALSEKRQKLYSGTVNHSKVQTDALSKELLDLKCCFPHLSIYEKRAFIRLFEPKIVWDGTNLHAYIGSE